MEETRKKIQLHKKGDKTDQWIPLNTGSCVQLTDYKNDGVTNGAIKNAVDDANGEFDDLNVALMKLENRKVNPEDLHDVAFSGDYNDLENLPDIQSAQSDWEEDDTESMSYINNKPNLHAVATSGDYDDLENKPNLHAVATSGDYDDLENKPTINNSEISFSVNGTTFNGNSFTLNQSGNGTIDIPIPSFLQYVSVAAQESDLPVPSTAAGKKSQVGHVYKVSTSFNYNNNSETANVGDLFIYSNPSTNVYEWIRIPSGDERYNRVVAGVDGLCPALPTGNDASSKFLNGEGNWAVPTDTNTTYTMSFANGVLTLTPSTGTAQTANIPNDNTTYTLSFSNGVLTLTPSTGTAQSVNIPNDNTTYTMSFSGGVLTLTPSTGTAQTITIPDTDTKVTSSANHYTPATDSNSDINGALASGDSVGQFVTNTEYDVITGVKAKTDGKGHVTDLIVTKQKVKDTNNLQVDRIIRVDANGNCVNTNSSNKEIGYYNSNDTINELTIKAGYNYLFGTSSVNDGDSYSITTYHSPISSLKINNIPSGVLETNITFKVASGFTFELPVGARYVDAIPTWEADKEYIVSCYKGVFVFGELTIVQSNNN